MNKSPFSIQNITVRQKSQNNESFTPKQPIDDKRQAVSLVKR